MTAVQAPTTGAPAFSTQVDSGIAVVTFDLPNASVNTLGPAVGTELAALLDRVERDASIRAVVLISGKPDIFIAGADIEQFVTLHTARDAEELKDVAAEVYEKARAAGV